MNPKIAKLLGYNHRVELQIEEDYLDGYYKPVMCWVKDVHPLVDDNHVPDNWIIGIDYDYDEQLTTLDLLKALQVIERNYNCAIKINICINYTCRIFEVDTQKQYISIKDSLDDAIQSTILKYLNR